MTDHPITPPPELVQQWTELPLSQEEQLVVAARWGADQELEACCEWLQEIGPKEVRLCGDDLRQDRRPKPPSLKEQALAALAAADGADHPVVATVLTADQHAIIRRALEALND